MTGSEGSSGREPADVFLEFNFRYAEGVNTDYLITSVNSAFIALLERVCGLDPALNFPNTLILLPNIIIGETFVDEANRLLKVRLSRNILRACSLSEEELEKMLSEGFKTALNDASEGSVFKHGNYLGKHLKNLGEEVSIRMNDGSVVTGEVVGFTARGELLIASESGLHVIKPSNVKEFKTLWP